MAPILDFPSPPTVPVLLAERTATRGGHPLLICDDEELTYEEASMQSAVLARSLLAAGIGKGGHVGILLPTGPQFVVAWLAAARIGAVSIPLSTFSTSAEIRDLLRCADVELLLATPEFRNRDYVTSLKEVAPSLVPESGQPLCDPEVPVLRRVVFDAATLPNADRVDASLLEATEAAVRPADRMVIVHTSGSTGAPKGVIHQHGPLIEHVTTLNRLRRYSSDETLFSNSPFFWIGGFAYSLLGTLLAGATLVCSNATRPSATLDVLERARPTMVNGFAAAVAHLAEDPGFPSRDLTSIRRGNLWPIMPDDVRPADPDLRHNMLGMTEAGSVCLASEDEADQPESRRGSFGRPVPGLEAKVVDPESGEEGGAGSVGELWLRGSAMMEGYYGRSRSETFEADGWYRSGDLFHVDGDGFFYFHGRRGDMIKTAGANVAPRDVEAAIADVLGLDAYVVGVDDPERGQVVAAAVSVPREQSRPDEAQLRSLLRERLSAYKIPRQFVFVTDDHVPRLSSGKVDARGLREMFTA